MQVEGEEAQLHSFLTLALGAHEWSASHPIPLPLGQEHQALTEPVWALYTEKYLAPDTI
jgi:hypothetical protein